MNPLEAAYTLIRGRQPMMLDIAPDSLYVVFADDESWSMIGEDARAWRHALANKPRALWVDSGAGYWIVRSRLPDGWIAQGSALTLEQAYNYWLESIQQRGAYRGR